MLYKYIYIHIYTEEATEMVAKYLHNEKMLLIIFKELHIIRITTLCFSIIFLKNRTLYL